MSGRRKGNEFSEKTKLQRWTLCDGRCEYPGCGIKLFPGKCQCDHDIAVELGGDNSLENARWLCLAHHKGKTKNRDMPAIKKVRRQERREKGIRPKSKFQTSRDGPFKMKMNGQIVPR